MNIPFKNNFIEYKTSFKIVFLCIYLITNSLIFRGQEHTNFIHLTPRINNKHINYTSSIQDQHGYIWMVHSTGISKFDGNNYHQITNNDIFKKLENSDRIISIHKDFKNNIWVISQNGLVAQYDSLGNFKQPKSLIGIPIRIVYSNKNSIFFGSKKGTIYSFNEDSLTKITSIPGINLNSTEIISIAETSDKDLFISTDKGKIFNYSTKNKKLSLIEGPFSDYPGNVNITLDLKNRLWVGSETFGLSLYDINRKQFIQDEFYKGPTYNIKKEMIISLFCDSTGLIWAGTDGGGLYRVDTDTGKIKLFTHHSTNKLSLSSNTLIDINEDLHGNIWVLSNYGAMNILPGGTNSITYHEGSDNNTPVRILSIYKSSNNDIWAGTDGNGITKIKKRSNGTTYAKQYFNSNNLKKGLYVQSITEDNISNIWFGTYKNGLWHYNINRDKFEKIPIIDSHENRASDVRTVYRDTKNRIWVGSNLSLNVYSSNQKLLASFENNTHGLKGSISESIIEDTDGNIWIGYFKGGLFKLNENSTNIQNSKFSQISYYDELKFKNDIPGVKYMDLDEKGYIWLINAYGKLIKFNPKNLEYYPYENFEPLKNLDIRSVLSEDHKNLWLSSTDGIFHFNLQDSLVSRFGMIDGLQDNTFLQRSAFKDKQGDLYFGGVKGLNYFNPKKMEKKESKASLYINSLEVLNQPAKSLIPDQISTGIDYVENIELQDNQSSFSFRFSAIGNVLNSNYYYAYRLLGFDNNWIPVKKEQLVTYTNIPSGKYTFEVKAGSKKGVWDIPSKKIHINIAQPFWNQPISYLVYFLIFLLMIYWLKKWYSLKKNLISEKINYKKELELHSLKMNFFAKMSHEIQTPLTLIISPIDDMLTNAERNGNLLLKQRLQIISNNVKRLSRIVFELTTVRNKEIEKIRLFITRNNLVEELRQIALSFNEQARFKNIDFTINCPKNLSEVWYDKDKIEHIVYNLLSNAFKFTPKEGNIQINVIPINNKNSVKISISDSGPGIPKAELEEIFTLFYQSKIGKQTKGTGIGLALTKELINLHRGKIEVQSSPNEGTTFSITLPITEDAYLEEERIISETPQSEVESVKTIAQPEFISTKKLNKTILIVEDNFELQHFLKDLLSAIYDVVLAENGEEGYFYAKNNLPDLILSDIMMPKIDGIEMCKMLQNDQLTKHIPIVLLTAKNSTNAKLLGLKSGAIEFINKPFNTSELLLKINNIITSTEHILTKYKKESISHPKINIEKSQDDVFLENLVSAIHSNIENPNFKMEELADLLHMSYSALYRKCIAVTGQSLVDFVRLLRLKKAAIVIAKYGYSISEAAFMSGFNDPKYFSKCFKKQFDKTPNTFKKEAQLAGSEVYLNKYKLNSN